MSGKNIFAILLVAGTLIGMYLVSIGGFHFSPQKVRIMSGQSLVVANGRATLTAGQITYRIDLDVSCTAESSSISLDLNDQASEKVCGIQIVALEVVEGRFGSPGAVLEVRW